MSEIPINFLVNVFHGGVRGGGALKSVLIKSNKVNCAAYRLALLKNTYTRIYRVSHTHIQGAHVNTQELWLCLCVVCKWHLLPTFAAFCEHFVQQQQQLKFLLFMLHTPSRVPCCTPLYTFLCTLLHARAACYRLPKCKYRITNPPPCYPLPLPIDVDSSPASASLT